MPSVTVYKDVEVEIDVDLEDFEADDLQDELERRGIAVSTDTTELLEKIWQLRRLEQPYDHLMDELIYNTIGKIA